MRALVVVAMSPVIKKLLGVLQVAEGVHRKHFCLEAAVEALVFAVGLRVVGAAEAQADAQAYQPDCQLRQAAPSAPGRAVVDVDALRQAVLCKRLYQRRLHAFPALVGQCQQEDVVARVVVQDGQWVAASAVVHPDVSFEIHLPQGIGVGMLETLPRRRRLARLGADTPVAVQDVGDGAGGDVDFLVALEQVGDFAPTPGRMGIAHGKYLRFKRRIAALGAVFRTARPAFDAVAFKPFVGGFAANAEAAAKLAEPPQNYRRADGLDQAALSNPSFWR